MVAESKGKTGGKILYPLKKDGGVVVNQVAWEQSSAQFAQGKGSEHIFLKNSNIQVEDGKMRGIFRAKYIKR